MPGVEKSLIHVIYGRPRGRMVENQLKRKSLPHDDDDQRMLRCIFIDLPTIFIIIGLPSSSTVVVVVVVAGRHDERIERIVCLLLVWVGLANVKRMLCVRERKRRWSSGQAASSRRSAFGSEPICVYAKYALLGTVKSSLFALPSCVCIVNWRASLFVGCRAFLGCCCCSCCSFWWQSVFRSVLLVDVCSGANYYVTINH